jgi:hypothetical protein
VTEAINMATTRVTDMLAAHTSIKSNECDHDIPTTMSLRTRTAQSQLQIIDQQHHRENINITNADNNSNDTLAEQTATSKNNTRL